MAFIPNPLGNFNSYSYHISLIMPDEPNGKMASIANTSGVIIAETGKTANFYIDKLVLNSVAPSSDSGLKSTVLTGEITILEPLGFTFFDRFFAAKSLSGWKSLSDSFLLLKLSFNGWNSNGSPAARIFPSYIKIKSYDVECDFDINGSRYTIKFVAASNLALEDEALTPKRTFGSEIKETLADSISEFETEFNKAIKHTQNADNAPPDTGDIYKFSLGPYLSEKNLEMQIEPDSESTTSQRAADGKLYFQYDGNMNVQDALKSLCNQSKGIADLMTKLDENKRIDPTSAPDSKLLRYYVVDIDVSYGKFVNSLKRYQRIYEYQIDLVPRPEIEYMPPDADGSASDRYRQYFAEGVLAKRYDYYFTGQNTEVLDAKFDFNTMWTDRLNAYVRKQRDATPSITEEARESEQNLGALKKGISGSFPQTFSAFFGFLNKIGTGERYMEQIPANFSMNELFSYKLSPFTDPNEPDGVNAIESPTDENEKEVQAVIEARAYRGIVLPLIKTEIIIRGDPFWIDPAAISNRTGTQVNFNSGTKMFYFKMRTSEPHDATTGLHPILGKNTISAFYYVTRITSTFEAGKFTQVLNGSIDPTTVGVVVR
jgi:hypothetical protein